ncbi:MAG: FtsX-like permease family protein [Planctomycetes bacterium]|nr:FtsX-like permease family protein [Planctomycetota bacterium]
MGLALQLASRSLRAHPGRAFFSILGVAVGIATAVAVFTLDHTTVLSRTSKLDPGFGADLEVRSSAELSDPKSQLLALEGVAGVAAFFQNDVRVRRVATSGAASTPDAGEISARLIALEEGSGPSLGVYHVESGADLSAMDANGVLLGRALAAELGVAVGDEVVLAPPVRAANRECVEGVLREKPRAPEETRAEVFHVGGLLAAEGVGRRSKGALVVIGYQAGRRLFSEVFIESQFWLKRDGAVDLEVLESELAKGFTFERNEAKAVGQMADERAFRNGVRVAGLFALLLGLFVIFHTLSMSLVERVREVGTLFSLSASRTQIARVFFAEALVIAGAAGALGLAGGLGLTKLLLRCGITTLGVQGPQELVEVPWVTVSWLVGLGVAMALLGSVYPLLRLRGTDVVATLRGDDPGKRSKGSFHLFSTLLLVVAAPAAFFLVVPVIGAAERTLVGTLLGGLVVLGLVIGLPLLLPRLVARVTARLAVRCAGGSALVAKLAARNLEQSPGRIGASISAVALVVAAFVGLKGMTRSLAAETEVWGVSALSDRVLVENLPESSTDELVRLLHTQPEVLGVETGEARAFPSFLLLGLRPDELARHGPLAAQPELLAALRSHGIVLSERLARQRGLGAGDQVLLRTSGHGVQTFRVTCVSDAYGYFFHPDERAYGIIDAALLERFFCVSDARTRTLAVKLAPGADHGLVEAALRTRLPEARFSVYDGPQLIARMLTDLTVDFVLFDIILFLTALLAGLGVLNGQLLAAIERRKELGILVALGTSRAQLAGVVLVESLVVGVLGGGLGAAVGLGLTPVLVTALRVLSGLDLPLRSAGPWVGFACAAALLLTLAAGLYPLWRANRTDVVRAVRTG